MWRPLWYVGPAAARANRQGLAGASVTMLGSVGKDAPWPLDELRKRGVRVDDVRVSEKQPTGRAFIQISSEDGENSIVLLKGANFERDAQIDEPARWLDGGQVTHLMLQNEIPLPVTEAYVRHARAQRERADGKGHVQTIFNPSPMPSLEELRAFPWAGVDVLVVNEGEAGDMVQALGDGANASQDTDALAHTLAGLPALAPVPWVVVTKGADGVIAGVQLDAGERTWFSLPSPRPKQTVNTTGAGDTFTGYLTSSLMQAHAKQQASNRETVEWVLRRATTAASMAVEVDGAMESIPALDAVEQRERTRS